ncbi:hypothetical protein PF005_g9601 [Phytophthora fragariae]|uniref:Uncharacterized protein n=1 Tax=Phytophthora fragariae TaxID=53985 RepID=A0A6A3T1Y0_9STRA|nr:hypothetical protein PF009_g16018 [Phytophthora fragariae]KAE9128164.1 hypothetical protein PF007_g5359 [Phytophthora fragariae]KAE9147560.1 hypothetical protein PF006_g7774 [Phytophthora fragariae]KAE9167847.1 hypothetical protein PF002_g30771 [Phytophthora fragariae]KAE9214995.1 hypothetical protein PF005_g9601 [Phytophthora fragariae]
MSVLLPRPRAPSIVRVKLKWDHELNLLLADSQFEACYRMPAAAFVQLENLLATTLHRSPHAWVQRGYISVENALQLTLRYLAGGGPCTISDALLASRGKRCGVQDIECRRCLLRVRRLRGRLVVRD